MVRSAAQWEGSNETPNDGPDRKFGTKPEAASAVRWRRRRQVSDNLHKLLQKTPAGWQVGTHNLAALESNHIPAILIDRVSDGATDPLKRSHSHYLTVCLAGPRFCLDFLLKRGLFVPVVQ